MSRLRLEAKPQAAKVGLLAGQTLVGSRLLELDLEFFSRSHGNRLRLADDAIIGLPFRPDGVSILAILLQWRRDKVSFRPRLLHLRVFDVNLRVRRSTNVNARGRG